jgi:hypothetical protein
MYCLAGLSGCENLSRYDPPQEGNCPLDASADRTKLGMLKPTGRAMCPIIEHSEELDNVFHVLLNKVSYGIVCNALLMQKKPDFRPSRWLALLREFTVGKSGFYFFVPGETFKYFCQEFPSACAEMPGGTCQRL